uniref:(northern house mosquito) hypothetical protein n=1 Tax=Culex pipiens TaxID=7175 RepID=A0A8D8HGF4_CULPI
MALVSTKATFQKTILYKHNAVKHLPQHDSSFLHNHTVTIAVTIPTVTTTSSVRPATTVAASIATIHRGTSGLVGTTRTAPTAITSVVHHHGFDDDIRTTDLLVKKKMAG